MFTKYIFCSWWGGGSYWWTDFLLDGKKPVHETGPQNLDSPHEDGESGQVGQVGQVSEAYQAAADDRGGAIRRLITLRFVVVELGLEN